MSNYTTTTIYELILWLEHDSYDVITKKVNNKT